MTWQEEVASLVERRIGIVLKTGGALGALDRFVRGRIEILGLEAPQDYVERLAQERGYGDELARLVGVVTNGQTSFFRDNEQFYAIGRVLQDLARELRRPLSIWSAACATGEEPYSLAILAAELGLDVEVLGTDINRGFLKVAKHACYGEWALRQLPEGLLQRYFTTTAPSGYCVAEPIKARVRFQAHNLVDAPAPSPSGRNGGWDLVLCRNVFIYYRRSLVRSIVGRMAAALEPHGWLFVGVSESLRDLDVPLGLATVASRHGYRPASAAGLREGNLDAGKAADEALGSLVAALAESAAVSTEPEPEVAPHVTYTGVLALLDRDEREAARRDLGHLLERDAEDSVAWLTLGNLHLAAHSFDLALEAYGRAQALEPLLAEVHFLQGVVHRKLSDWDRAEQALRRAIFLDSNFWPAAYLLAGVYERAGRASAARAELEHVRTILASERAPALFRSYVRGMDSIDLRGGDTARMVERRLNSGAKPLRRY